MPLPAGYEIESSGSTLPPGYQLEGEPAKITMLPSHAPGKRVIPEKSYKDLLPMANPVLGMVDAYKKTGNIPDAANYLYQNMTTPPETPTSFKEFATRNIPEDLAKTGFGVVAAPAQSVASQVNALGTALSGHPIEGAKQYGNQLYGQVKGVAEGLTRIPRAVIENPSLAIPGVAAVNALRGKSVPSGEAINKIITRPIETGLYAAPLAKGLIEGVPKVAEAVTKPVEGVGSAVKALADKSKIPTTFGEQTGNPFWQRAETILEKIPFSGMTRFRKLQNVAAESAAKEQLGKYIVDPEAGDVAAANREYSSGLFEQVKDLIKEVPKQEIPPTKTKAAATALLDRYPDIFKKMQDTKTEGLINDIVAGTKTKTENISVGSEPNIVRGHGPKPSPKLLLDAEGKPVARTITPTLTFDEAWTLRQGLGEKIGQARKLLSRGDIDHTAYSQLKTLFGAVSEDLGKWSDSIGKPEIVSKFKEANNSYKNYVVKYDIMQRAFDKAVGTVGAGEMFSPKKFSTALKNIAYKDQALKNFTPAEIESMTGLANILQIVKRAGQFKENVPTGNRIADAVGIASITKLPTLPLAWTAKFLTTTEVGQNMLRRASNLDPRSSAMTGIVNDLKDKMKYDPTANNKGLAGPDINTPAGAKQIKAQASNVFSKVKTWAKDADISQLEKIHEMLKDTFGGEPTGVGFKGQDVPGSAPPSPLEQPRNWMDRLARIENEIDTSKRAREATDRPKSTMSAKLKRYAQDYRDGILEEIEDLRKGVAETTDDILKLATGKNPYKEPGGPIHR